MKILYILSLLILVLTSCGFQPIYKTADRNIDSVNYSVKFKNEPGYEVKNKIKEVFNYSNSENLCLKESYFLLEKI